ncbi:MAG TPA: class II D-tagatose-bisphosphate aldolase, non-catalytic subunit [Vicinamibacteria bacterium]|jgi:D-tagatose-1,6-bisphosphate aldolase subunit GatZ/KbaZ
MTVPAAGVPLLPEVLRAQKRGEAKGLFSICSANPFVLEAALLRAKAHDDAVCIESTSNQVNSEGGYTGTKPAAFAAFVRKLASDAGFPFERVLLGGDHLGPFPWRGESAGAAMDSARETVRQYVLAGCAKIHLDASMRCADDPPGPLGEEAATERAADLCDVAEKAVAERPPSSPRPLYVIGTEVPVPGGEQAKTDRLEVTRVQDAERTLDLTRRAFRARDLEGAWERVVGLVVQPGVEFGDATVFEYDRGRTGALRAFIEAQPGLVYEAHSTDYQTEDALHHLVADHFAILKVGPALTFAFREGVFALAEVEREWLSGRRGVTVSNVRAVLEEEMLKEPSHWRGYHHGGEEQLRIARQFGLSDRIRYYWARPAVRAAVSRLIANLSEHPAPPGLLSQYLGVPCAALRRGEGKGGPDPRWLVRLRVEQVIDAYARACGTRSAGAGEAGC